MSQQDHSQGLKVSKTRNEEPGSSAAQDSASSETRAVNGPAVLLNSAPSSTSTHTRPYTHRRIQSSPPLQDDQQWGPTIATASVLAALDGSKKSPIGHQRSMTVPTITLTQPTEPAPRERLEIWNNPLAVRRRIPASLPVPGAAPEQAVVVPRVSRLAGLQGVLRSAETRKGGRKGRVEEGHARKQQYRILHLARLSSRLCYRGDPLDHLQPTTPVTDVDTTSTRRTETSTALIPLFRSFIHIPTFQYGKSETAMQSEPRYHIPIWPMLLQLPEHSPVSLPLPLLRIPVPRTEHC